MEPGIDSSHAPASLSTQAQTAGVSANMAERRSFPRQNVDCRVLVSMVNGAASFPGQMSSLSLGGCSVTADDCYLAGILVRVEVQFQLGGICFRLVGVTSRTSGRHGFAVRFLDIPANRQEQLAEVLQELKTAQN